MKKTTIIMIGVAIIVVLARNWDGGNQNKGHLSVAFIVCMFS